ncbi:MAG: hypothetical protein CSA96_04690 [Bacteroidetes bacterium]|nr:MAG: hypothetical protein CSA96_04690 [Bacteroidota bacterium]
MKRLSIVILNWNGLGFLRRFLPLLMEHSRLPGLEIVIADNASGDGSIEYLQKLKGEVRLIRFDRNYGFAGGYNRALDRLDSELCLLLNSDVEVGPGWLTPLLEHMDAHPNTAACAPKVLDYKKRTYFEYAGAAGGFIDKYGYPFCRGRIFDHLEADRGQYDDPLRVFWATGACLLIRSKAFKEAGGLDELFFAHMEEIDLCWRLGRLGYDIYCIPQSTVYHVGGGSLPRGNPRKTYLNFRNNLLLLHKNLPLKKGRRIIFFRMLLDGISGLHFLIRGRGKDLLAIIRAHWSYFGMKNNYRGSNEWNILGENGNIVHGIYQGSIVSAYFLKGKRSFKQLKASYQRKKAGED